MPAADDDHSLRDSSREQMGRMSKFLDRDMKFPEAGHWNVTMSSVNNMSWDESLKKTERTQRLPVFLYDLKSKK